MEPLPPGFDYHQSLHNPGPATNGIIWTAAGLATIFLAIRLWAKASRSAGIWWDDGLLILSWTTLIAGNAILTHMLSFGWGTGPLSPPGTDWFYSFSALMDCLALAWSKTSWAVTLLRLTDGWRRHLAWFAIVSINTVAVVLGIAAFAHACGNLDDGASPQLLGSCWRYTASTALTFAGGVYGALMDCILAALPWFIVRKLFIAQKEKQALAIAMSLGVLAGAVGFARNAKILQMPLDINVTYNLTVVSALGQVEPAVSIIAASIPCFRLLLRDAKLPRTHHGTTRSSGSDPSSPWSKRHTHTVSREQLYRKSAADSHTLSPVTVARPPPGRIMHTREFRFERDHDRGSVEYEMWDRGASHV
ncbi:hypothetical protein BJ170DRAFT_604738 [Xylariales sp. AK1849]|nr:hypothetical protein BJ170DRAFT_604738 [Xylariales sp. AK1849]